MKRLILVLVLCTALSCHKNDLVNNNPYIQNVSFSKEINMNLPSYNALNFVSNPILITDPGVGVQGIIVMKAGVSDYRAWEASCPIQYPTPCSRLTINGVNAKCSCDNKEYSIYTGDGGQRYPMKAYRVEISGSVLRVYN